uniref:Chlororespiratory reduction 41 n=1 Tax=Pelargonium cotyledonis TaxID=28968 RepID=A0A0F7J422_9ROSI|nr:chlororespiratory reduction 41 [Pelargonium cotyledonis]
MASTSLAFLSQTQPKPIPLTHLHPLNQTNPPHFLSLRNHQHSIIKCTSPDSPPQEPEPTTTSAENFPIEKRIRSEIIRERRSKKGLAKPEPPNFEIGWKRTKKIETEKPKGYIIADFLEKLEQLMDQEYGSTELLAAVGEIVAERSREEAEVLRDDGEVEERMVTELFRLLKLIEMDLAMVKAAVKEETLNQRLEQAKARCRQAILVANSF